jgi:hypothetical protein
LSVGKITLPDGRVRYAVFNWGDAAIEQDVPAGVAIVTESRTGVAMENRGGSFRLRIAPREAVLLEAR